MDYETLFPGRFIKAVDLKGKDVTLTIVSIAAEEIDGKTKAVITFEGTKKQLVLNRTNAEAVKLMFGRETNDWLGKRVTIYPAVIQDAFGGGGDIPATRVRGSPDISKPMNASVQRGRKTIRVAVQPTGRPPAKNGNGKAQPTPPSPSAPPEMTEEEKKAAIQAEFEAAGADQLS